MYVPCDQSKFVVASRGQFYLEEGDSGDRVKGGPIRTGGESGVSEGYGATRVQWA